MNYSYSIKKRNDGVYRIGRDSRTIVQIKDVLLQRRLVIRRNFETLCWEYTGQRSPKGYGVISFRCRDTRVHRLSWMIFRGQIPKQKEVCHHCDNPCCFNPDHLFIGTHAENMRDAFSKGRVPPRKGESHGCSKLTNEQVRDIRNRYVPGTDSRHRLAKEFGVSHSLIWQIAAGEIWKHI